jgi:hypothetical protein
VVHYLRVKNWEEFQHYKDRLPPWIKFHAALLNDYAFSQLADAAKAHLALIWLLASQKDGRIPDDPKFVADKIGAKSPVNLRALVEDGWLIAEHSASNVLQADEASRSGVLSLARSRETEAYKATEAEAEQPRAGAREELPAWLPESTWKDFVAFRRSKKGWTPKAALLCLRELSRLRDAGNDPVAVLEQSIANAWSGLFPVKTQRRGSLAERRAANVAELTGRNGHDITGTAERMDQPPIPALPSDLRESGGPNVGRRSGRRDPSDVGD